MTTDFSRSIEENIQIKEGRKLYAIYDFTRDDSTAVNFSDVTIKMEIYTKDGGAVLHTLTSGDGLSISTARVIMSKTFTDLEIRSYYYELFDDTNKQGIQHGKLIVI